MDSQQLAIAGALLLGVLAAVIAAAAVGALIAVAAFLAGMQAGVRARQGHEPVALFGRLREFLEAHLAGREAQLKAATEGGRGGGGEPGNGHKKQPHPASIPGAPRDPRIF